MAIDWWTIGLEGINFLILVALLWRFLYRPVGEVIERRREHIQGELDAAAAVRVDAETLRREADERLGEIDDERDRVLREARETIESERRRVVDEAREDADAVARAVRRELADERAAAADELRAAAAELAVALATRLVEQVRDQSVAEVLLSRAVAALAARREAGKPAREPAPGEPVVVRTAPELDPEAIERWRDRLRRVLGADARIEFEHGDHLVAGVELILPAEIVRYAWADTLAEAQRELSRDADAA